PLPSWEGCLRAQSGTIANAAANGVRPDVLVLGSSLVMGCLECDKDREGVQIPSDSLGRIIASCTYTDFKYFRRRLSELSKHDIHLSCLPIAGCMASDQLDILNALLGHNKKPSVLVSVIAPRD